MTYYLISFFTMVQDDKTNNNNLFFKQELKEHSNEIINN